MREGRIQKIGLAVSAGISAVFFFLSFSSLCVETDLLDSSFHTPWFSWQVDAEGVYFLTAVLCLVTTRLVVAVFHQKKEDPYEALIEG